MDGDRDSPIAEVIRLLDDVSKERGGIMGQESQSVEEVIGALYRAESRRVFASLARLLRDLDRAEEAMHEAFAAALEQWPNDGIPQNPRAWLISTGRFRAIDSLRRRSRLDAALPEMARRLGNLEQATAWNEVDEVEDDRLRLIFTCCHPSLADNVQVALTLREVCGLSTEEIASAFLVSPTSMAQRIVRGKAKIREAGIPFIVPAVEELPDRLASVLSVIYLVFNEGYRATSGDSLTRPDLSDEAIRLGRLLVQLLPDAEAMGLLALMLLHESRRPARADSNGDIVLLEDQDRSLWNQSLIAEGQQLVNRAMSANEPEMYALQAAISAQHSVAANAIETDWSRIVELYDALLARAASPVVALNRAVAVGMRSGPSVGLELIDQLMENGSLEDYHLAHAARADFCRRLGRLDEARTAYEVALSLARQEPERRFLSRRLEEMS